MPVPITWQRRGGEQYRGRDVANGHFFFFFLKQPNLLNNAAID